MKRQKSSLIKAFFLILLVSCKIGGGESGSSIGLRSINGGSSGSIISGIAAIGAPLGNAKITVFGKACEVIDKTDSSGQYSVNLSNCTGPYLLRAENDIATIHSVASLNDFGKDVSITPITELIAGRVFGTAQLVVLDKDDVQAKNITITEITEAKNEIGSIVRPLLDQEDGLENFDIINSSFTTNGTGFDKILDSIDISPKDQSSFGFKIKGIALNIDLSMSGSEVASVTDLNLIQNQTSNLSIAGDYLNEIRARLVTFNEILRDVHPETPRASSLNFFDTSFLHGGLNREEALERYLSLYHYIEFLNPVLADINVSNPLEPIADVFLEIKTYDLDKANIPRLATPYKIYMRFKKVGNNWLFHGDQIPVKMNISALNLKYISNKNLQLIESFYRGLLIDLDSPNSGVVSLNISADNFFSTNVTIGRDNFFGSISNSAFKIGCTEKIEDCNSFLKISNEIVLPKFLKLKVDVGGISYYTYTTTPKVVNAPTSFPGFSNIPGSGMCGTFEDSAKYHPSIRFSIPEGHLFLSLEASSDLGEGIFQDFGFGPDDSDKIIETNQFSKNWIPYKGNLEVKNFMIGLNSVSPFGFEMRTVYSCIL